MMSGGGRKVCEGKTGGGFFAIGRLLVMLQALVFTPGDALNITRMSAPLIADPQTTMLLECHFDMGTEELFAVKWYKDGHEFYRYTPSMKPATLRFPVAGVRVVSTADSCRKNRCDLMLADLTRRNSSGEYKCEVSSEAPSFRTVAQKRNVTVAALPKEKPRIEDLADSYTVGDHLIARCISAPGNPKPQLSFYINKQQLPPKNIKDIPQPHDPSEIYRREIQIRVPLERRHWNASGKLELECASTVPGIPPEANPRMSTVKRIPLQDHNSINNQKLHWPNGGSGCGERRDKGGFFVVVMVVVMVVVRW